ncbi:MAG TPA: O-antigen ligase family protein [Syntrophorhabdaceae bacterium]|jgi:O-antigen ligase
MDKYGRIRTRGGNGIRINATGAAIETNIQNERTKTPLLQLVFYVFAFVILARPQDLFPFLVPFRPVLVVEAFTLLLFILHYSELVPGMSTNNKQVRLFIALIGMMVLSIPLAYHRSLAFGFVIDYLKVGLFFFLFLTIADTADSVRMVLKTACLGVLMYTLFILLTGLDNRTTAGGMFDANDIAFFIISFLPFNFLFLDRTNSIFMKVVSILNLGLGSLTILLTGSRGGFVSLLLVFVLLLFSRTRTVKAMYKVLFVVLCLALIFFKSSSIDFARLGTVFSPAGDYNLTDEWGRKDIWERGIKLMITHPVTGVGAGCFDMALGEGRREEGKIPKWQTAHNSLIQVGAETGLAGLVLFLLLSFNAYKTFSAAAKKGRSKELIEIGEMARIGFAGQFVAACFLSQAYSPYYVFYIALSVFLVKLLDKETDLDSRTKKVIEISRPFRVKKAAG